MRRVPGRPLAMPVERASGIVGSAVSEMQPASSSVAAAAAVLNVQIGDVEGVFLDEVAAGFDHVAHQAGEDFVGYVGLGDFDL